MHATILASVMMAVALAPAPGPTARMQIRKPQIILPPRDILRRLPEIDSVMVYKTFPDREWVEAGLPKAMEFFGVGGQLQPSRTAGGLLVAQQGRRYAEAYEASGASFCADLKRIWPLVRPDQIGRIRTRELSREVTLERAQQLVRQLGALPREKVRAIYLPDEMYLQMPQGETRRVLVSAAVVFRRVVEGMSVEGPGGKLKVYFDMGGQPAGLLRTMRVLQPYKKMAIRSAKTVLAQIRKQPIRRQLLAGVRAVEVSRIKLVYYEGQPSQPQKFLQPVYMVTGVASGRVGERSFSVPYCEYIPALKEKIEPVFGVAAKFQAKPRSSMPAQPQWQDKDE